MSVYFAQCSRTGDIKIGTSDYPPARVREVGFARKAKVVLMAEIRGEFDEEIRFHLKFIDDCTGGEWFRPTPELMETIEAIKAGSFDIASLPKRTFRPRHKMWPKVVGDAA